MFEKWEEKELPFDEANLLIVNKKATLVRVSENKDDSGKTKLIVKVKQAKQPKAPKVKMTKTEPPKEVKIGRSLRVRFQRYKKAEGTEPNKRVTIAKASVNAKAKLILRKTGLKQLPFAMHYVDRKYLNAANELEFDEDIAEPINPDTGEPEWSDDLEELITQGGHNQMVEVATRFWKFILTRQHLIFMAMGGATGLFAVLGLAVIFHFGGGVQINWEGHAQAGLAP